MIANTPKRRWLQFGLRTLLLLMLVLSVCFAAFAFRLQRARQQAAAVEAVRKLGGRIDYDFRYKKVATSPHLAQIPRGESPIPSWLLKSLGEDFFHAVVVLAPPDRDPKSESEITTFGMQ